MTSSNELKSKKSAKTQTQRTKDESSRGEPIAWVPDSPDGGWGWMVVFGAFLVHVFADGIVYSFGIMIVEFLDTFNEGRGLTSWIVGLLTGLTLGAGPIASAITNRYGCRTTTILGSVIASFGCAISVFATSILYLMISVGVIMGFGFSLVYCPSIIMVTMYFDDRRALATGIAVCGAGIGTFIFAPLTSYLIEEYSWRGAFLIDAGIVLNCAVCGALFRPLKKKPIYQDSEMEVIASNAGSCITLPTSQSDIREITSRQEKTKVLPLPKPPVMNGTTEQNGTVPSTKTTMNKTEIVVTLSEAEEEEQENKENPGTIFIPEKGEDGSLLTATEWKVKAGSHLAVNGGSTTKPQHRFRRRQKNHHLGGSRARGMSESAGYLNIPDVFYLGSLRDISRDYESHRDIYRSLAILNHDQLSREEKHTKMISQNGNPKARPFGRSRSPSPDRNGDVTLEVGGLSYQKELEAEDEPTGWWQDLRLIIRQMTSVSILKDPIFLLFAISNFLTSVGFNAPLIFLPDKAYYQLNISKEAAAWTLSAFGISNTIGRVLVGWVSDKQLPFSWGKDIRTNRLWIYNISLTFCGVITSLSFLCTDIYSLIIYTSLFGFSLSTYICLTSVLLVDLMGIEKLTNAFGLLLLFQGVSSIVGPPIAGWIVDTTSNYDMSFIFAGINLGVSGVMLYIVPCLERRIRSPAFLNRVKSTASSNNA